MIVFQTDVDLFNEPLKAEHSRRFNFLSGDIPNIDEVLKKLMAFQVAIPSWALGTGGTRFGRFSSGGEPGTLEEKINDIGLLHALNKSSGRNFPPYSLGCTPRC